MLTKSEILTTLEMVRNENLDVRAITLGLNLLACASDDLNRFVDNIHHRITQVAGDLVAVCDRIGNDFGIPVVN
jgi:uncharacterized protein (UPF0210 family)